MARFELRFKRSANKDLQAIPGKDVKRILKRIESLKMDPRGRGCIKLTGKEYYRVRVGNFRIIYEIREAALIILIVKISNRRNVYN